MSVYSSPIDSEQNSAQDPRSALWPTYAPPLDLVFSHGQGSELFTEDGRTFLDCITGIAVTGFGHAHPDLVRALSDQAGKVWHLSNMFRVPGAELLAQRLVDHSFADAVFFTNSGTESVEAGLKAMRAYQAGIGQPQRNRIIGFKGSFHGRTIAAVAAAGNPAHCNPFIPSDYGFDSVPWGDLEALEAAIGPHTAGIVLEPVQGEGGVRPVPDETLRAIRKLCDQHGLLLMFDEVQCGAGRTGALFAHQLTDVTPDIMALAKGLGGGFPMGACLATSQVSDHMVMGTHGTTYGGNPLAMAVANKVLDLILEPKLLPSVRAKGEHLRSQLAAICAEYPEVFKEVTGRGLMVGLVCGPANTEVLASLRSHGVLVGKAGGNMIRLLPPMNISQAHLDKAIDTIRRVAAGWNIGS